MLATAEIVRFVTRTAYEGLPREAVEAAKRSILDGLGCALAARGEPSGDIVVAQVRENGGVEEAGVIGAAFRAPAAEAAWANGVLAHALDYDDYTLTSWIGHPTVAVLPAVLALAEKHHLSGKNVLMAYLVGFETGSGVALACGRRHYELGWHNTATIGSLASASACARLLGLTGEQTTMCLGVAASLAGGLRQNFGTMTKPLHAGNAARNGVLAAQLAARGFTADGAIMESDFGFERVLGGGAGPGGVSHVLGEPFDIVSPGVSIKPWPSCGYSHWAIDAALSLKRDYRLDPDRVSAIEMRCDPIVPQVCIHSRPRTGLEGKFSLEFCVAVALMEGELGLRHFTDDEVRDPGVQRLMTVARYVHPPELQGATGGGEVAIRFADGRTLARKVLAPRGTPENPLSWDDVCAKFRDCASRRLDTPSAESVIRCIAELEVQQDVVPLMDTITRGRR